MNKINLYNIGLTERFKQESTMYEESLYLARVSVQHKDKYKVITEYGELWAEVSGKFKFKAFGTESFPAVGDWVMVDRISDDSGNAIIHHVLRRKSSFERTVAGNRSDIQIVATNIDIVFICMALNDDFNIRRLERYLSIAWDSMATPVIVLTKSDLCDDVQEKLLEVETVAIGVDVSVTSSINEDGYDSIKSYIMENKTVAFIGSSGIGKSTIVNGLMNEEILATGGLRNDGKGRHTTTYRQLVILPNGGVVIDTPGMRELQISSADFNKTFSDIENLALKCKFSDCNHESEPRCAVRAAIENGDVDEQRLENYRKLQKELKYQELKSSKLGRKKIY
ncbi:ribosome small subunit-dependent GTPase A [Clostridium gasigenes]|uniref:Small ribosomal subunit biogenesis GTPase RsgA n=1 Tax=Clostridium gasigenes TaxID=94869 RepID=A0A7X0SC59_9CLOT|nr:ribosome small subunit-dependent GTPase A [Clostridium gasigenes]MBB6714867.1 ribosome small subunit-dependent GTPase A [Clostridium gasigenes]